MVDALQILTLMLVVVAMVPALAHGLELPGKLRLSKDAYFAVQPIYYPGFTIAGVSEPLAVLSALALLLYTPHTSGRFWLILMALLGLVAMHVVYWLFTHPVNDFWLKGQKLSRAGSGFFAFGSPRKRSGQEPSRAADWTELRDRWEYSHVARAGLAGLSFLALVVAISSTSTA